MKLLTYKSGKADALGVLAANEKEIYPLAALRALTRWSSVWALAELVRA